MEERKRRSENGLMRVKASVRLLPADPYQKVGDFDLNVGDFSFYRVSDEELRVDFSFATNPVVDDRNLGKVFEIPHQDNQDLMQKETELDSLLDLLSLSEDIHLRIDHDSYSFTYPNGRAGASTITGNDIRFDGDGHLLAERFENLKGAGDDIIDSLRFHRLGMLEFDDGERAVQLWNIIEKLYGKQPHIKYLSKDELGELETFLAKSSIPTSKHDKIIGAINAIHPVNTLDLYAGRIQLKNQDGTFMSDEDKKEMFGTWKKLRNYHGHGTYILRHPDLSTELFYIGDTVRLFLEDKVSPRMYHVVLFKSGSLNEDWQKSPSVVRHGDWFSLYSRGSDKGLVHSLEKTLLEDNRGYVIYPNRIFEVSNRGYTEIEVELLPEEIRSTAIDMQLKMHETGDGVTDES